MNQAMTEGGCDARPSIRGTAGEVVNQLQRLKGDVDSLFSILQQSGIAAVPALEAISKAHPDAPRDTSLAATLQEANSEAMKLCNRVEEIISIVERELL